jgi:hypothetical protein
MQSSSSAVSRNHFNMPVWIAEHRGMFADEGLDVAIRLYGVLTSHQSPS